MDDASDGMMFKERRTDELNRMLDLAESLRARNELLRLEQERFKVILRFLMIFSFIVGILLAVLASDLFDSHYKDLQLTRSVLFVSILSVCSSVMIAFYIDARKRSKSISLLNKRIEERDGRALTQLLRIVRETKSAVAEESGMSTLEKGNLENRLKSFDIDYVHGERVGNK